VEPTIFEPRFKFKPPPNSFKFGLRLRNVSISKLRNRIWDKQQYWKADGNQN